MAEFTKKLDKNGKVFYLNVTNGNKRVKPETLPVSLKEELDLADAGTIIDEETVIKLDGDGAVDAKGNKIVDKAPAEEEDETAEEEDYRAPEVQVTDMPVVKPERINPYARTVEATEDGFGFPRKGGKTVDIFDGVTPHTHIRAIEGKCVPLSKENYETKTDAEIFDRLVELNLI